MAFTTMFTGQGGNAGNVGATRFPGGPALFVLAGADFTGVTVKIQYSDDNVTFYDVNSDASPANNKAYSLNLPEGFVRANLSGGGSSGAIGMKFKALDSARILRSMTGRGQVLTGITATDNS